MAAHLFRYYQRHRIVNINLNIIGAGLLAVALAKWPVYLVSQWIGPEHKLINALVAGVIDGLADIAIYFVLHWVANHWRPIKPKDDRDLPEESRRFWKNATLIQFERLALSPAFYAIAIGGMWGLQHAGISPSWAFVLAFSIAIIITRIVHTIWGLRTGRFVRIGPTPVEPPAEPEANNTPSDTPPADAA